MTDLRKAANMALYALEYNCRLVQDFGSKEQLHSHHEAIMALYKSLAQNPLDIADRAYFAGKQDGIAETLAQGEQEKESALCDADPRLLLGRSNNFTKETENRLCDIERRLAAIETQPAPPSKPWVSLTDEEIDYIWGVTPPDYENFFEFPRAIEAALRKKNNG